MDGIRRVRDWCYEGYKAVAPTGRAWSGRGGQGRRQVEVALKPRMQNPQQRQHDGEGGCFLGQ